MELCFMGEMRETLVDVTEAFQAHFEEKKLPVLHITKFDMIGDTNDTTQVSCKVSFIHIVHPGYPILLFLVSSVNC